MLSLGNQVASRRLKLGSGTPAMTSQDVRRHVVYGGPLPYRDEIQAEIGEGLRAHYGVHQYLPYRLLVILMQLKELDRTAPVEPQISENP